MVRVLLSSLLVTAALLLSSLLVEVARQRGKVPHEETVRLSAMLTTTVQEIVNTLQSINPWRD